MVQMRQESSLPMERKNLAAPYPCSQGTEITVEGLFYQTPARLKHMRSGAYEASLIQDVIARFAMSHPEIAFHLINDGRDAFRTSGQGDLLEVLYAVYGKAAAENAIPVAFADLDYQVSGYLIKPLINRASRNMMHIFLNGRMVRTYKLYQSVQEAYDDFLPHGRYPMCVLSITMDPHLLDVNVHPSKWEVRISKETQLEVLLKDEVYKALCANEPVAEKKEPEIKTEYYQPLSFDTDELTVKKQGPVKEETGEAPTEKKEFVLDQKAREEIAKEAAEDNAVLRALQAKVEEKSTYHENKDPMPLCEVIGQYRDSHILASCAQGLAIIDQKAAEERVEYEKLQMTLNENPVMMDLLVPLTIHAGDDRMARIDEINQAIVDLHICFEPFGRDTLMVRSIPAWMKDLDQEAFLNDVLDLFAEDHAIQFARLQKKQIALLASKNSVHIHQKLTIEEMRNILLALAKSQNPWTDPSGHPVITILEESQMLKGFRK
jgi:DNA mismatch repair protein MutL